MKKSLITLSIVTSLLFILFACSSGVNNGDNAGSSGGGTESGLYLGIIGFNENLYKKPISLLNSSTQNEFDFFIDGLSSALYTSLYYAYEHSVVDLESVTFPTDLSEVFIITFTDGLDEGSGDANDKYRGNEDAYLKYINDTVKVKKIQNIPIISYSIGVEGGDVGDNMETFIKNLNTLASSENNAKMVNSMDEVNQQFIEIANSLYKTTNLLNLNLAIKTPTYGDLIRFTFNASDEELDADYYIEGVFGSDGNLSNVVYHGITANIGVSSIVGIYGEDKLNHYELKDLKLSSGESFSVSSIKEWIKKGGENGTWGRNSEFDDVKNMEKVEEKKSAAIMLVLDCSSSLGSDFEGVKSAAKEFVNILVNGQFNEPSNPGNNNTSNIGCVLLNFYSEEFKCMVMSNDSQCVEYAYNNGYDYFLDYSCSDLPTTWTPIWW